MREYFDDAAQAATWAMRHQKNGWFAVVDQTEPGGDWFVDVYLVESEDEAEDVRPSDYMDTPA